ncbi:ABC transporter permease [Bdellovibrionota bacterium FG-1]
MNAIKTGVVTLALARVTFREIIRDKILYNVLLCGVLLFGVAILASRLMIHQEHRVILDFGLSAVNLSGSLLAMLVGASILSREIDRRTILVVLAKPITRHQFVLGKLLGLAATLVVNWVLLSAVLGLALYGATDDPGALFQNALVWGLVLQLFQSLLIGSAAFAISAASTTSLAVIISIGLYLIGNNMTELNQVAAKTASALGPLLRASSFLLPHLEHFTLGTQVTYNLPVPWEQGGIGIAYALVWMGIAWVLAGVFLSLREL